MAKRERQEKLTLSADKDIEQVAFPLIMGGNTK